MVSEEELSEKVGGGDPDHSWMEAPVPGTSKAASTDILVPEDNTDRQELETSDQVPGNQLSLLFSYCLRAASETFSRLYDCV